MALKVSPRPFKQVQFAKRLFAAFDYLLTPVVAKDVKVLIAERTAMIPAEEIIAKQIPAKVEEPKAEPVIEG